MLSILSKLCIEKTKNPWLGYSLQGVDINGKTHLVNIDQLKGFESVESIISASEILLQHTPYEFGFGSNMPECQISREKTTDTVQPTRMLSDKISISKFLSVFQKGFHQLNRFQSRTYFYARPYLYDRQTKIGFIMERDDYKAEIPVGLPLHFQWSTGRNFGPQGTVTLGASDVALLPNVEPVLAAQFSGKYHFLSLSFAANLWAFSYGSDYIIQRRSVFNDYFSIEPISKKTAGETISINNQNEISKYLITGNTGDSLPFTGKLIHKGWKLCSSKLPKTNITKKEHNNYITLPELESLVT